MTTPGRAASIGGTVRRGSYQWTVAIGNVHLLPA
ncbi:MAG: hypothetical protein V7637_2138 [Mycobacteriales bacterium]